MYARKWTLIYLSALVMVSLLVALGTAGMPQKTAAAQEKITLQFDS
jgi:hypothetical protein